MNSAPSGKFITRFRTAWQVLAFATDRASNPTRCPTLSARGFALSGTARRVNRLRLRRRVVLSLFSLLLFCFRCLLVLGVEVGFCDSLLESLAGRAIDFCLSNVEHAIKAACNDPEEIRKEYGVHRTVLRIAAERNVRRMNGIAKETGDADQQTLTQTSADGRTRTADLRVMNPAL